jgi:glycine dehydrogenase subunit 1
LRYLPHTEGDVAKMLAQIGVPTVDALFEQIPEQLRLKRGLKLPPSLSEPELMEHLNALSRSDIHCSGRPSFLGAGAYDHHLSPTVDQLLLRSELYTAYTPYQPEVSQGTLQSIFEFQTAICRIFEMGFANASMYDGASAAAEAALMARRLGKGRERILVSKGLHPEYIDTIGTYLTASDNGVPKLDVVPLNSKSGGTDPNKLSDLLDGDVAAVIVGYPNFFGVVEDLDHIAEKAHAAGALLVSVTMEPYSLGVLATPGTLGADIAVGEGQPLANPLSFGGPGLGLFTCRDEKRFVRQMPGRLVGKTTDAKGQVGYVLTLATREQHIRREKATSNICTNHGLCALAATIQLCLLGRKGFKTVSNLSFSKAEYLKKGISALPGFSLRFAGPSFNEFAVRVHGRSAQSVLDNMDIPGGVDLGRFDSTLADSFLVAVTERHSREQLDAYLFTLSRT